MKKWIARIAGFVMVLCMVFATIGCGLVKQEEKEEEKEPEKPTVVGTWEAEVDYSAMMGDMFDEMLGEELAGYGELKDLYLYLVIEMKDDNTYIMTFDEESTDKVVEDFVNQLMAMTKAYLEDEAKKVGVTLEDVAKAQGYASVESYFDSMKQDMDMEAMKTAFEQFEESGAYKLEENKLYLTDEETEEIVGENYYEIELELDTMTWEKFVGEDEEEENMMLPLVFKKK